MNWHEYFTYNATTGDLIWKERKCSEFKSKQACGTWNKRFSGRLAGAINSDGYRQVRIRGRLTKAHRIAWMIVNGPIPDGFSIDHINGDPGDNRIDNLRLATHRENCRNQRMRANNTSGFKGVFWHEQTRKWQAKIRDGKKQRSLGLFETREDASAAYAKSANNLHGEFARPCAFTKPPSQ